VVTPAEIELIRREAAHDSVSHRLDLGSDGGGQECGTPERSPGSRYGEGDHHENLLLGLERIHHLVPDAPRRQDRLPLWGGPAGREDRGGK
jgi:hypothetical protein